jgi:hypothetical protein
VHWRKLRHCGPMLLSAPVPSTGPGASRDMARSACIGPTATALMVRAATARMAFTAAFIMAVRASNADGGTPKGCFG